MIKFFRKIRQNLLSEGKTGKYLKYAIGEILLVVIGILIALQINNWNELRKEHKLETRILNEILTNLETDIENLEKKLAPTQSHLVCQLCNRRGHSAGSCRNLHHFSQNMTPPTPHYFPNMAPQQFPRNMHASPRPKPHNRHANLTCRYCLIKGHIEAECRRKLRDQGNYHSPGMGRY